MTMGRKPVLSNLPIWGNKMNFLKIFFTLPLALWSACSNVSSGQSVTSSLLEDANETFVSLTLSDVSGIASSTFLFQFFDNDSFSGTPVLEFTKSVDLEGEEGDVLKAYTFLGLDKGNYYLLVILDINGNNTLDSGEKSGSYQTSGSIKKLKIGESNRQAIALTLN